MKVLLGVTGCIGAYKAAEILRGLQKAGAEVRVMMTRHATEFITPLTLQNFNLDDAPFQCALAEAAQHCFNFGKFRHGFDDTFWILWESR